MGWPVSAGFIASNLEKMITCCFSHYFTLSKFMSRLHPQSPLGPQIIACRLTWVFYIIYKYFYTLEFLDKPAYLIYGFVIQHNVKPCLGSDIFFWGGASLCGIECERIKRRVKVYGRIFQQSQTSGSITTAYFTTVC